MRVEFRERPSRSLILWRGRQWLVTSAGIETVGASPRLLIRKSEIGPQGNLASGARAVEQICPAPFDEEDFAQAWNEALRFFVKH